MPLPFTRAAFLDVFGAYNAALWPGAAVLWLASALTAAMLLTSRRPSDRFVSGLLAVHWAWSAVAYHMIFFARINPAAWLFGLLFLVQAGVFAWRGAVCGRIHLTTGPSPWRAAGWLLVAYSLGYPALTALLHDGWARIPTFGVPCPTTLFTTGLLLLAAPEPWFVSAIPILWSAIGGSAAILLGVRPDYALPVAGFLLGWSTFHGGSVPRLVHGPT